MNPMPSIPTTSASTAIAAMGTLAQLSARLVIEAECTTCGRLCDEGDGISTVQLALVHTTATGHVVILNGTTDLPEADDEGPTSLVTGG